MKLTKLIQKVSFFIFSISTFLLIAASFWYQMFATRMPNNKTGAIMKYVAHGDVVYITKLQQLLLHKSEGASLISAIIIIIAEVILRLISKKV